MKVINIILIVVFVLSAALQYNDPDPYLWIPVYLFGAFLCYRAIIQKYDLPFYVLGFIGYGSYAVYLFFSDSGVLSWWQDHHAENIAQSMKATKPWIEETREFIGLLLLIATMIMNTVWLSKRRNTYQSEL
jgi:hypothetical protein